METNTAQPLSIVREYLDQMPIEMVVTGEAHETVYHRPFSEHERVTINETLAGNAMQEEEKKAAAKKAAATFRAELKMLEEEKKKFTKALRSGLIEQKGMLYKHFDLTNGTVHIYDDMGVRRQTRRMNAEEAQLQIP